MRSGSTLSLIFFSFCHFWGWRVQDFSFFVPQFYAKGLIIIKSWYSSKVSEKYPNPSLVLHLLSTVRCRGNIFTRAGWLLRLIKQQREQPLLVLLFQRKRSAHWFLTLMRAIKVSPKSHFERPISQEQQTPKGNTARLSFFEATVTLQRS